MAVSYGIVTTKLAPEKGDANQALGVPAGDIVEVKSVIIGDGAKLSNPTSATIWIIHHSTLTAASAFTSNAGYAAAPNQSWGWELDYSRVYKTGALGATDGTWTDG